MPAGADKRERGLKVAISYPPLEGGPGVPLLSQNRQFQWFASPTYIYPVVPAYAATMLKDDGFDVLWDDAIAKGLSYREWLSSIRKERPDVIAIETKTPVVKRHWEIIREIKGSEAGGWRPSVVLMGDHVTALPEESMEKSPVDFVLTGGDYDFLLLNLMRSLRLEGRAPLRKDGLEPGIWLRDSEGPPSSTGPFRLDHSLERLPKIDRALTMWRLYSEKNGNFKRLPGTYTMAGRDCWWAGCTFCSWTTLYPRYRVRPPSSVLDEIGELIEVHGVREIMDDTGTFPTGEWLNEFSTGMIERGYGERVLLDCNMRFGAVGKEELRLMKKAGFRLLLFGLESANPKTLERLNKGVTMDEVMRTLRDARSSGLFPHVTIMFGYPWESPEDAMNTIRFGRHLLKKGLAWTVQATVVMPYPGTPLFKYCRDEGLLKTLDWDDYDMRCPVMKTGLRNEETQRLVHKIYSTAFSPEFVIRRLLSLRDREDLKYFLRGGAKVFGHLMDFGWARNVKVNERADYTV